MTINSTTAGTNSVAGPGATATPSSTSSSMNKLANENTFLQLFVSQLKNQDPLNPSDGTQFVSQLAQFSELEQVIGINQNVSAIRSQVAPAPSSPSAPGSTASSQPSGGAKIPDASTGSKA